MEQELEIQQEIMLEQEVPLDISSCLFVRNAGIKVIENDKVNIEKQPADDCFFIVAFLFFVISIYIPLLVV